MQGGKPGWRFIFFGSCDLAADIAGRSRSHRAGAPFNMLQCTTIPKPMSSTMSPPTCSSPKGDDDASSKDDSHPSGAENKCEGAGGSAKHQPKDEKAPLAAINRHEDADDDEHDWHSAMIDEEYPNDDEYSYGDDDHDEYSISDYIQNEIERQLTEEIDAALQREIDAQLDRAMEECERELDRQLDEEIGRSLSQSVQIGDGRYDDEFDADEDRPCMYRYCSSSSTHATNTKSASSKSNVAKTSGYGSKGDDIVAASKKGGEDDVDLLGEVAEKKLLNQNTTKNESNSNSRSAASSSMKAATSVVDVNRAIQSVIDSHKIR